MLVCLIPTTIGGLVSAIGISGIDRLTRHNVLATSGRAVEAAGDVDVLLLDKTGTITLGNRQASEFIPARVSREANLPTPPNCPRSPTRRRRADRWSCWRNSTSTSAAANSPGRTRSFVPFTAETRMSGVDFHTGLGVRSIRKGAVAAVQRHLESRGGRIPAEVSPGDRPHRRAKAARPSWSWTAPA